MQKAKKPNGNEDVMQKHNNCSNSYKVVLAIMMNLINHSKLTEVREQFKGLLKNIC